MMDGMAVRFMTVLGAILVALQLAASPAVAASPPSGLPQAAVQTLGVMDTSSATVAGIRGYRMRLWVGGTVYVLPGGDKTIVTILKSRVWVPSKSVLFRSGSFIVFAPSFLGVPNAILVPGKHNGLEAVDPAAFLCADRSIPGPRLC